MGSKMEGWTVRREEVERKNGEGGRRGGLVERGGGVSEREREGVSGRDGVLSTHPKPQEATSMAL